jgi:2-alkenal reductase
LQQTVTQGIVSAKRNPEDALQGPAQIDLLGGAIQTDAAINPGNSGGPLFDIGGQVMGVDSAILSQSGGNEGIGFAIPSNVVMRVVPELIQNGRYRHPLIGVVALPLSLIGPGARQLLGLSPTDQGLLVIESSGPAAHPGDSVTVTIVRGGQRQDVTVTLAERPATTPQGAPGG